MKCCDSFKVEHELDLIALSQVMVSQSQMTTHFQPQSR